MTLKNFVNLDTASLGSKAAFLAGFGYLVTAISFILADAPAANTPEFWDFYTSNTSGRFFINLVWFGWIFISFCGLALIISFSDGLKSENGGKGPLFSLIGMIGYLVTMISHYTAFFVASQISSIYTSLSDSSQSVVSTYGPYIVDGDGYAWFGMVGLWLIYLNKVAISNSYFPRNLSIIGIINGVGYILMVIGFLFQIDLLVLLIAGVVGVITLPLYLFWLARVLSSENLQ